MPRAEIWGASHVPRGNVPWRRKKIAKEHLIPQNVMGRFLKALKMMLNLTLIMELSEILLVCLIK